MRHRREIASYEEGIEVVDWLEGSGPRLAEIAFQVDPALSAEIHDSCIQLCRDGAPVAELSFGVSGEISIASGGARGEGGGWVSDKFGSKVPAPRICWRGTVPPDGIRTRIALCRDMAPSLLHSTQEGFSA
jgi:hypothetical protein